VKVTTATLTVDLTDGRTILYRLLGFPRLLPSSVAERNNWRFIARGEKAFTGSTWTRTLVSRPPAWTTITRKSSVTCKWREPTRERFLASKKRYQGLASDTSHAKTRAGAAEAQTVSCHQREFFRFKERCVMAGDPAQMCDRAVKSMHLLERHLL